MECREVIPSARGNPATHCPKSAAVNYAYDIPRNSLKRNSTIQDATRPRLRFLSQGGAGLICGSHQELPSQSASLSRPGALSSSNFLFSRFGTEPKNFNPQRVASPQRTPLCQPRVWCCSCFYVCGQRIYGNTSGPIRRRSSTHANRLDFCECHTRRGRFIRFNPRPCARRLAKIGTRGVFDRT
jgi:hypothetical protein